MAGLLSLLASLGQDNNDVGAVDVAVPKARGNTPGAIPPDLGNARFAQQAQDANAAAPAHKGMFGVKGTLRDVLGTLGDAFLTQAGKSTVYAPQRDQERAGDALSGFTENPMAAIERLAQADPKAAQALYNNVLQEQSRAATLQQTTNNQAVGAADKKTDNTQKFLPYAGSLMGGAKDQGAWTIRRNLAKKQADALGIDFDTLGIPDTYDEETASGYRDGSMTGRQSAATQQGATNEEGRNDRSDKSIAAANSRAAMADKTKRETQRPAPNPTAASIAAPALAKIQAGEALTPGEEEVLKRAGYSKDRGDKKGSLLGGGGLKPAAPTASAPVKAAGAKPKYRLSADGKTLEVVK